MSENLTFGSINDISYQISQSEIGSHNILIYPRIDTFRELYSNYIKRQLKRSNEIIFILPYYETAAKTKEVLLSQGIMDTAITIEEGYGMNNDSNSNNNSNNNKRKTNYEKEEKEGQHCVIIKDSLKVYSFSSVSDGINNNNNNNPGWNLIQDSAKRAKNSGKSCVTVIADLGSFYHHDLGTQRLIDYELLSLPPSQYDSDLKLKGFCVYHKKDFEEIYTRTKTTAIASP